MKIRHLKNSNLQTILGKVYQRKILQMIPK